MSLFSFFRPSSRGTQGVPAIPRATGIPGVDHRTAVAAFEGAGFWVLQQGEHVVMTDGARVLTIPRHDPVNAITLGGLARDAGLTAEQFRDLC